MAQNYYYQTSVPQQIFQTPIQPLYSQPIQYVQQQPLQTVQPQMMQQPIYTPQFVQPNTFYQPIQQQIIQPNFQYPTQQFTTIGQTVHQQIMQPQYIPQVAMTQQPQYDAMGYSVSQPISFQPLLAQGKKKALLIGINYFGATNQLKANGFKDDVYSTVCLTDDQSDINFQPTRANILKAMKWLVSDVKAGDSLFFMYSGHGTQVKDLDGDEDDGLDEAIMPVDNKINGNIIDDDINAILVQSLPHGARLTGLVDACHSGSCMDLPYVYSLSSSSMTYHKTQHAQGVLVQQGSLQKSSNGDVVLFSSCQDAQTSSDLTIKYASGATTSGGAMTSAFMKAIKENPGASYAKILDAMRAELKSYAQVCQLSSARPMDMGNTVFAL